MSQDQQLQLVSAPASSKINATIFLANDERIVIMKDGRVIVVSPKVSRYRPWTKQYFVCTIYRNDICFNSGAHYYTGDVRLEDFSLEGSGEMVWPNGDRYVGGFDYGFLDGEGEYTCSDGRKYVGFFDSDQIEGKGMMVWPDGSSYEGVFSDGKIDPTSTSPGKFTFPNGDVFIGDPFGQLSTLVDLKSEQYSFLLQQAEPKPDDTRLMRPDAP